MTDRMNFESNTFNDEHEGLARMISDQTSQLEEVLFFTTRTNRRMAITKEPNLRPLYLPIRKFR